MTSFSRFTLMALVLGLAIASTADAKPKKPKTVVVPEVTVTGCVTKGSGSFCWNLKAENGTNYSFAGQPAVEGKCYTVTGPETLGACRQGTQLGVTKLEPAKYDCCTLPPPPPAAAEPGSAEPAAAAPKK